MYLLLDKLYGGLDVQAGGFYHLGDSRAPSNIKGFTLTQGLSLSFRKSDIYVWAK